ncbi:MAG: GGDEF domain-containing protein [Synechococcales cyanobacterium RM1_1_8]|nr:GGDEF domain-containing protein [Synechococcales cyanobacterium RM1_1_8]
MDERPSIETLNGELRLRLMTFLTLYISGFVGSVVVIRYAIGSPFPRFISISLVSYCAALLALEGLAHSGRETFGLACWVLLAGFWGLVMAIACFAGGLDAPSLIALPLLPVLAMLLLGRRNLYLYVGGILLSLLCLYQVQVWGWILPRSWDQEAQGLLQAAMLGWVTLGCGLLAWYCDWEQGRSLAQLAQWAHIDGLTGLANRRRFDERLEQEWMRNQRYQNCISLLLIDIDHFKQYNDSHGHVEGDRCLALIAQAIAHRCRRSGELVARYGGEEFAVILPNVELAEAAAIANVVLTDIASLHSCHPELLEPVTVSIGFATIVPDLRGQQQQFIAQADEALYRAKRAGRNQAVGSVAACPLAVEPAPINSPVPANSATPINAHFQPVRPSEPIECGGQSARGSSGETNKSPKN